MEMITNMKCPKTITLIPLIILIFVMIHVFNNMTQEPHTPQSKSDCSQKLSSIDLSNLKVFYYEKVGCNLHDVTVVLLHGARFNKDTWKFLGTLDVIAHNGYNYIAFDLPGYGESKEHARVDPQTFLPEVNEKLKLGRHVVVSPSMSGSYTIPYVFSAPNNLVGWVAVAPVGLSSKSVEEYRNLSLPVLSIFGEEDTFVPSIKKHLGVIPGVKMVMVPHGSHPCYLDDTHLWHSSLLEFLLSIR